MVILTTVLAGITSMSSADATSTWIKNGLITDDKTIAATDDVKVIRSLNDGYNQLTSHSEGYQIDYPQDMMVDSSTSDVKTVLYNDQTKIEIYHDDFNGTVHYSNGYTYYSNVFLKDTDHHTTYINKKTSVNGKRVHLKSWDRPKLARVQNDKNHYLSAEIVKNSREVYTVLIKSSQPIAGYERIINSFRMLEKQGQSGVHKRLTQVPFDVNEETQQFYDDYFVNNQSQAWGIFHPSAPEDMAHLNSLEEKVDHKFDVLVRYQTLETDVPVQDLENAYDQGRYVELTLQTMYYNPNNGDNSGVLYDILNGDYDDYFNKYAQDLKEFGHPVLFRLNNEMNGDWCVYSSYHHSKDTDIYKESWRYIYSIFEKNDVDNVLWLWNPHDISYPNVKWNHHLNYFPGEEYVDIVGLTGYNTGTYYKGEIWREFDEIYPALYAEYMAQFDYPFMITEFGSNQVGGNKGQWVDDMFSKIEAYENIKVVIWFNGTDYDTKGRPARIYRLDNSDVLIDVFRKNFDNMGKFAETETTQISGEITTDKPEGLGID